MSHISKEQYLDLLYSCADNSCDKPYCFFKMFLEKMHPHPRILCQFKCIEIFKWERSKKEDTDIGSTQAAITWCEEGWASAFNEVYEEGQSIREIYNRTQTLMGLQNQKLANVSSQISQISTSVTSVVK